MKYSINSSGYIVAERDIYSLGGFIPKGSVGARVANEDQISQDGECWVAGGDISTRPDVRVKDNAYIGNFAFSSGVHTDRVTEFSGNTLIPGPVIVRNLVEDPVNSFFVKDSFIGVSMDVLCGPSTTATAFPFEQGDFKAEAAKGTLFNSASMRLDDTSACRNTATLRLGRNTYLYIPTGYRARVFWAYYNTSNQLAYSGESTAIRAGLIKLNHSVYRLAMVVIVKADGTAMTPADLLATGAKILGHISDSVNVDIRPESASGQYVMNNSYLIVNASNFGLAAAQKRILAGGLFNSTMYTLDDRAEYKIYGTFHNVQRLEYAKYLSDTHRTNVNRDRYISAYDCPLLRVDNTTYDDALAAKGNLVLRRCIVPKAEFLNDIINGNTFEDIDFSYANEDLGFTMAGYARFVSSHKQGIYRLGGGPVPAGFASHKGNLADTARLFQAERYLPLDGNIIEQGAYGDGGVGSYYEASKSDSPIRIRTGKPLATFGLVFPSLPAGYSVKAFYYLDEDFVIRSTSTDPTRLDTTYPYVVMLFRKDDDSAINVTDFIALNRTLRIIDHTKAPEVTGSAYVGAGCTVRGDVQLHGDPYVNRVLDVNMWERGSGATTTGGTWEETKVPEVTGYPRLRTRDVFPVDAAVDNNFTCASGYEILIYYFGEDGKCSGYSPWGTSLRVSDPAVAYISIIVKSVDGIKFIDFSDIPLANVKYLRAFKKRRYITNELDRKSPEDILIGPDYWEQGEASTAAVNAGKPYEELKIGSPYRISLKRPFGLGAGYRATSLPAYSIGSIYLDAATKLLYGSSSENPNNALFSLVGGIAGSPTAAITPTDVTAARAVIEFTPTPRIIVPYGASGISVNGMRIRMYDNAVLSRNLNQQGDIVLQGDAVMGYDFNSGSCMCSNGHSDAIIKLP